MQRGMQYAVGEAFTVGMQYAVGPSSHFWVILTQSDIHSWKLTGSKQYIIDSNRYLNNCIKNKIKGESFFYFIGICKL